MPHDVRVRYSITPKDRVQPGAYLGVITGDVRQALLTQQELCGGHSEARLVDDDLRGGGGSRRRQIRHRELHVQRKVHTSWRITPYLFPHLKRVTSSHTLAWVMLTLLVTCRDPEAESPQSSSSRAETRLPNHPTLMSRPSYLDVSTILP